MTFNPVPFDFGSAFLVWLVVFAACVAVGTLFAVVLGLLAGGTSGVTSVLRGMGQGFIDLGRTSPTRVWAVTLLTFREALRRKALLVFVLFAILFMFSGWFLTDSNDLPGLQVKVHVAFVLRTISWLILPIALLLACWGIPEDIRRRSLHTVVTKPIRRSEIVIGRVLGYVGINTLLLIVMSLVGFVWILRQVPENAKAALVSRVPVYGDLAFIDPNGNPGSGVNVGDIWTFRQYVASGGRARGIYTFDDVGPEDLATVRFVSSDGAERTEKVLQLESSFEAFRTYKGDIGQGLLVQYTYVNPDDPSVRYVDPNAFEIKEFGGNIHNVPNKLEQRTEQGETKTLDLFKDLAPNGRLRVEVGGLDPGQYLGMAPSDLFIRTPDRNFASGFFKAVLGIWLMATLVALIGVTASTFLKGPIATLLTLVLLFIGQGFRSYLDTVNATLRSGGPEGGGPIESIIRIVRHMNPSTDLPNGVGYSIVEWVDKLFLGFVWVIGHIVPDFGVFNLSEYVANGFDVSWSAGLLPAIGTTLAFALPCILLGYYSLRFRELEAK